MVKLVQIHHLSEKKSKKQDIRDVEEGLKKQLGYQCDLLIRQSGPSNEINVEYCASKVGMKNKELCNRPGIPIWSYKKRLYDWVGSMKQTVLLLVVCITNVWLISMIRYWNKSIGYRC